MQLTGGGLVAGDERDSNKGERETEREREKKYAQDKSDRESLKFKFLLEFSDKNFYYQAFGCPQHPKAG